MPRGVLAFDIDGTLVQKNRPLPPPLIEYMQRLSDEGWIFFFATGRTLQWSRALLSVLRFPYFLAPYNGACTIHIPENKVVRSFFLDWYDVLKLSSYIGQFGSMLYEAGGQERIFYNPLSFSKPFLDHLYRRRTLQKETWTSIDSLEKLPPVPIASVRFFLSQTAAALLSETISRNTSFHSPTMKDSIDSRVHIVQVTAAEASKGSALKAIRGMFPGLPTIAAGDDNNDIDLLRAADIRIAMGDAPDELKTIAHIIASDSNSLPIISAIEEALSKVQNGRRAS